MNHILTLLLQRLDNNTKMHYLQKIEENEKNPQNIENILKITKSLLRITQCEKQTEVFKQVHSLLKDPTSKQMEHQAEEYQNFLSILLEAGIQSKQKCLAQKTQQAVIQQINQETQTYKEISTKMINKNIFTQEIEDMDQANSHMLLNFYQMLNQENFTTNQQYPILNKK